MGNQYNNDHEKRLSLITWVVFISSIVFSILITLGILLLLAAGVHYIWGVIEWNVRGVLLPSQRLRL